MVTATAFDRVRASLDGEKVRFQALFFANFAAFSGFAVFRNVYLEEMGMSGSSMGQIGFLMTATGVVAQPIWGVVSDYLRAEKSVIVVGAAVSAVALLAYPAADGLANPFLLVAVGTAIYSAFRAPIVPIANSLVLSRGYDYGNIRAFGSVAFGIGSLGFGFLVAALGTVSVVYFYVLGMAVLVAVVWTVSGSAEADATESAERDGVDGAQQDGVDVETAVRALLTNVDFIVVLLLGFVLGASMRGGSAFFSVYMRAIEASLVVGPWSLSPDALTGVAWAVKTAFEALAFVYAFKISWSYRSFLVVGGVALTLPNLVYALTSQPLAILGIQVAGGLGYGLYYVAAVSVAHVVASDRVSSTAQTVLTAVGFGLGGAVGQVFAGELVDLVGVQEMYLYVAALGFVGAVVGLFVRQKGSVGTDDAVA